MVDVLVFSRDRAAQLDLLLRSIDEHAPDLYSTVTVLYRGSSADYLRAYSLCFCEHENVRFVYESNFERDVRFWLSRAGHAVSFLVDDDVFYRDCVLTEDDFLDEEYVRGRMSPVSLRGGDYDYPFSVDGNIYNRGDVAEHLARFRFRDPTELEARAHDTREHLPFDTVDELHPPCLVGVPANRVSERSGMPHMGVSTRVLNDAYLRGERISCRFDRDTYPAHWPVEYELGVLA